MSKAFINSEIAMALTGVTKSHIKQPQEINNEAFLNSIKDAQSSLNNAGVSQASEQASNVLPQQPSSTHEIG